MENAYQSNLPRVIACCHCVDKSAVLWCCAAGNLRPTCLPILQEQGQWSGHSQATGNQQRSQMQTKKVTPAGVQVLSVLAASLMYFNKICHNMQLYSSTYLCVYLLFAWCRHHSPGLISSSSTQKSCQGSWRSHPQPPLPGLACNRMVSYLHVAMSSRPAIPSPTRQQCSRRAWQHLLYQSFLLSSCPNLSMRAAFPKRMTMIRCRQPLQRKNSLT